MNYYSMIDFKLISRATMPSQFSRNFLAVMAIACFLTACDSRDGPGPDIHDSKYVALAADGTQMPAGEIGPCVLDQFTGLVWEVKTAEPGLRDRDNTYSWYDPNEDASGELDFRGKRNGGECRDSQCDTQGFVEAVNETEYCGFSDWRMPTRDELGPRSRGYSCPKC